LRGDLQEIEKAAERSQRIIRNLLDFSRVGPRHTEQFTVDDIVEKTVPMLKTALRYHRLDLQLQSAQALVEAEPHLLQQVLFNVINNACQALQSGGEIQVATSFDISTRRVTVQVRDNGPGIPDEVKGRIFEPFFTTKKEGVGTGLGLSMARSIVERFNGTIDFTSERGRGTEFKIELPLVQMRAAGESKQA
jgi:signal transduction histidine kinase